MRFEYPVACFFAWWAMSLPTWAISEWSVTGSLAAARTGHTATLLKDGRVLVVGGVGSGYPFLGSAELYDAVSGTWSAAGELPAGRFGHAAALMGDGRVLVTGGAFDSTDTVLSDAHIYDPVAGSWTPAGRMSTERFGHSATTMRDGTVLVVGDYTAELYDPVKGWKPAGRLNHPRFGHTASLLPDGSVLIAGGSEIHAENVQGAFWWWPSIAAAEIYDPVAGTWSPVSDSSWRAYASAAAVTESGHVIVTGGVSHWLGNSGRTEVFLPEDGRWISGPDLRLARDGHTATMLPSGEVLVAGGNMSTEPGWVAVTLGESELYSPAEAAWRPAGRLNVPRSGHTATLLADGRVLVVGGNPGRGIRGPLGSAELYGSTAETGDCKNHYILRPACPAPR